MDSLTARNNTKISLIEAYNSVFNYDLIAVSDTRLNQSILLTLKTYRSSDLAVTSFVAIIQVTAEYLAGLLLLQVLLLVSIYYKENVPIKGRKDLETLQESVATEITFGPKKIFFIVLYRHPHQTSDESDLFLDRLQLPVDRI